METTDLEFEHFLALELGMLVEDLRRRMTQQEYMRWTIFYARRAQRQELERLRGRR